uniref:Abnormal spindle microtubule assembly n=1 Tax=Chrysolophus pictus TaxID=9089 RepID=A0A8C3L5H5_CHRPC
EPPSRRDDSDEEPAVLVLSHFSRPPYLSFGSLRVGSSRTRRLGIDNPNAERVEVLIDRFPASDRGFSLERRRFSSGQRIFVYVTWTPSEEGKVRELVTFVVNGIVKHQAVLLGVAEQPLKKKKSLWDTIKKKNSSETSVSRKINKRNSKVKNVNKTFQVSQEADRLRSPLQSCENQNAMQNTTSPVNESPVGSENKLPISPIAPVLEELRTTACTPLSMRRSTTFSDIAAAVNEGLLPVMDNHNFNKSLDDHSELKSGSAYSSSGLGKPPISNDEVILNCTLSPVCTPEHSSSVPFLSTRKFLSPDTFVNDSYQVDGDIEPSVPILSPDQFVKDMQLYMQSKTPKPEAALISSTTETYVVKECAPSKWKKNGDRRTKTQVHVEHVLNEAFEVHSVDSQVLHHNKSEENHFGCPSIQEFQTRSSQIEQPKKRPVLSATVIKNKPNADERKKMEMLQPKSKKCLNSAIMTCENMVPLYTKAEISKHLPVIGPVSAGNKCPSDKVSSSTESTSLCRKRKNELSMEKNRVVGSVHVEEVERKRALTSSMDNKTHATVKPSTFKHTTRERIGQNRKPASKTTNRINKPIAGLAQSHLTFVKPLKTVIPRHPMPFAAQNMFYDERWKEKQQRGFTWWLNFVLTPDDFSVKTNTSQVNAAALILGEENHHKTSVPKAPTKEEASLKAYTARRRLNKLRRDACRLFTTETMVKAIKKLEVEIETRRLLVRRDRHLWKDVGERQKVLNWLLSYNPLWLRIGLETVYGELITLESNSDFMGLAVFILNRLLWNPDIAAEYRHPTVPHLYREGHEEALSKFTLKKLLLLVCFLDRAKQSRLIGHDPCLFCKDAEFKTSKDILLAISRDFLSGEGDLSRHLGFLGLPVSHIQTPLDEFDFAVTNLAVDLQCGIRLVRTMELLTNDWNLSKQLRVPAISRLQKMHNVDIVLSVLKKRGIHLKDDSGASIDCRDIVDRHRERTLALLWKIVFAFQVDILLNVEQLKEEIKFLKNAHKIKMQLGALKLFSSCCRIQEDNSSSPSPQSHGENVKLLMAWVNAVCGFYNMKVENFTVCFSDGRVLCHLIHHYHPCYVPLEAVCQRTTQTVECSRTHKVGLNCSSSSSSESDTSLNVTEGPFDQTVTASVLYKELLENEKKNFQLINNAVSDLGGIPAMIHHSDMSNTIPDEKVVITYLSFLCSRLLDLRQETRAARLIQSAWRKFRLKRELKLSQERDRAARIIQKYAINFLSHRRLVKKHNAAVIIQKHWRRHLARMIFLNLKKTKWEEARSKSATVIQASYRGFKARQLANKVRAAQVIQAWFRGWKARKEYASMVEAVRIIKSRFRTKRQRTWFLKTKFSALTIQRRWRATLAARTVRLQFLATKNHEAAHLIQTTYRCFKERRKLDRQKAAAVTIQKHVRAWQEAFIRGYLVRKKFLEQKRKKRLLYFIAAAYHHVSAIKIQRAYRMHLAYKLAENHISSVLIIQKWFRAKMQQKRSQRDLQRIIRCQRMIRGWLNRRNDAATVIQRRVRRFLACRRKRKIAVGIIKFQALWRGYSWRKNNDTAKTKALRLSLEKANRKCKEENKLCNRTSIAIEYLLKYKHISYILAALKHLEVVTRLSPLCCENMAQSRAIFTIFVLIRSCNRSVPCMDVIRYSVQVLLNVSKYERTTQAVYEVDNSIDTLLDLLQMYRGKAGDKISEKGGSIFTKTCCLLAILSKDSKRASEIRSMPRVITCIQSLYKLTARKCKMDAERTLVKQKTNTLISGVSFIPVTPLRIKTVSRIKPDWVLRKDNMQEVVDPLQAIVMVMDTLGIACY